MKLLLAIYVLAVSSGCVMNEKYPDEWVGLEQESESWIGECPDISGIYRNRSVADDEPLYPWMTSLSTALYSTVERNSTRSSNTVEINQPSEGIILVKPSEGEEFQISITEGHFSCKDGVINLGSHGEFGGGGIALAGGTSGYSLYDSEDQSLVLQERVFLAGIITIIPFVASTKDWVARWILEEDYDSVDNPRYSPTVSSPEYQLLDDQYVRGLSDLDTQEAGFLQSLINLPDEQILYVGQTALSYSDSDVTNTCYSDVLVLTDQRILAVWKLFSTPYNCPPSPYRGDYTAWNYTQVLSFTPESHPNTIRINLRSRSVLEEDSVKQASDFLEIRFANETEMVTVESIISKQSNLELEQLPTARGSL
jgi:hypothetical protein